MDFIFYRALTMLILLLSFPKMGISNLEFFIFCTKRRLVKKKFYDNFETAQNFVGGGCPHPSLGHDATVCCYW